MATGQQIASAFNRCFICGNEVEDEDAVKTEHGYCHGKCVAKNTTDGYNVGKKV